MVNTTGTTRRKRVIMIACVAVIVIVVAWMLSRNEEPKAAAVEEKTVKPIHVYPELGDVAAVNVKNGAATCGAYDAVPTEAVVVPDSGGTVSRNGTMLSADYTNKAVLVIIDGPSNFVSGWVTGANKKIVPFDVPSEAGGKTSPGLRLESVDFQAMTDGIADVTLCSMD